MKIRLTLVWTLLLLVSCGGNEAEAPVGAEPGAPAVADREAPPAEAPIATPDDPCAPLEASMVRFDTRGKPFLFSFERPEGFEVDEIHAGPMSGFDLTLDADGTGGNDYVLRFSQTTSPKQNMSALVPLWRDQPMTEKLIENEVDGRTMVIHRTRMGEMVGYQGLFPDFDDPNASYLVSGGITDAPKPCMAQAAEMVERILMSYQRNPEVGARPDPS